MCGIFALATTANVQEESIKHSLSYLRHRGPDETGVWISRDQKIGLGHTRLSIIDLETGSQPISNEDHSIHIVVNGEFYDYHRIREKLISKGHSFRTRSDSEIALHLYEEYGTGCLEYLRGEFALALWDEKQGRVFAARDRFGIKPLCYFFDQEKLLIASEAKAIFATGVEAAWDFEAYYWASSLQYIPPERTLFKDIFQLRPGHYLLGNATSLNTCCYWDLDYPAGDNPPLKDQSQLIEEFEHLLSEAVRFRLRSDVPICCHLSGGLDSSAVVALAAEHSSTPPPCFTIVFEGHDYNELSAAKETATRVGVNLHPIEVKRSDLLANLSAATYFGEGLAINGHLSAKYILSREIQNAGIKVALTGEGADELLAGYAHLRNDLMTSTGVTDPQSLKELYSSNKVSAGIMLAHGNSLPVEALQEQLGFLPSFLKAKATLGYRVHSLFSDQFKTQFMGTDCYQDLARHFDFSGQLKGRHPVNQSLYLWTKLALANYILKTLGDGMEMAHGVEGRLPFLDHKLFQFTCNLPISLKIQDGVEKYILRQALRSRTPESVFNREKHPFLAPPLCFSKSGKVATFVEDTIRSHEFAALPFYNQSKVIKLLELLPEMDEYERIAVDPVLVMALTTFSIQQRLLTR